MPAAPAERQQPACRSANRFSRLHHLPGRWQRLKMLKRHLATSYNLTPSVSGKWGLDANYPMVAPNYAERRSNWPRRSAWARTARRPLTDGGRPLPTRFVRRATSAAIMPNRGGISWRSSRKSLAGPSAAGFQYAPASLNCLDIVCGWFGRSLATDTPRDDRKEPYGIADRAPVHRTRPENDRPTPGRGASPVRSRRPSGRRGAVPPASALDQHISIATVYRRCGCSRNRASWNDGFRRRTGAIRTVGGWAALHLIDVETARSSNSRSRT